MESNNSPKEHKTYRLNKFLALTNKASSRRNADVLIEEGKVKIDGKVCKDFSFQINPKIHDVQVGNSKAVFKDEYYYVLLNKPKDSITTTNDEKDRRTVYDFLKFPYTEQLKPVGRLDRNTTGLLLFTNNGDFLNKLTHPSNEVVKIYEVSLDKNVTELDIENFEKGAQLEDGEFIPDEVIKIDENNKLGIQVHSGKNRIVRRYFEHFGFNVIKLDRVYFAGLTKYKLPRGKARELTPKELRFVNSQIKTKKDK
ncbi:MAG: pseudouridine synthase [Bacteroidia bacterium]